MISRRLKVRNSPATQRRLEAISKILERNNFQALAEIMTNPIRLIYLNFLAGLARGFGIAVGLTIITALFLALLTKIASLNLPIISRFIAKIVHLVEEQLSTLPR